VDFKILSIASVPIGECEGAGVCFKAGVFEALAGEDIHFDYSLQGFNKVIFIRLRCCMT
jgi:hypothetical protein